MSRRGVVSLDVAAGRVQNAAQKNCKHCSSKQYNKIFVISDPILVNYRRGLQSNARLQSLKVFVCYHQLNETVLDDSSNSYYTV